MHAAFTEAAGPKQPWIREFLARNPYFTTEEFVRAWCSENATRAAAISALAYYVRLGHVHRLRRGLFAVPSLEADPYLLATKLTPDAVVAYVSALALHGVSDLEYGFPFASRHFTRPLCFNELIYQPVKPPLANHTVLTQKLERRGHAITVTTPARTLVDCLDRLDLSYGFVETFEAILGAEDFEIDFNEAAACATALGKPVVAARVGAYLWGNRRWHARSYPHQFHLAKMGSRQTLHALPDRPTEQCSFLARFRLIVPDEFLSAVHRAK